MPLRVLAAFCAFVLAVSALMPASARPNPMRAPDVCQHFDGTGAVITIPWQSEGCYPDRDAFALTIQNRKNRPGWYPPLTCVVGGYHYDWDAPACAHARNQYFHRHVHPIYFGTRPRPVRSTPAPVAQPSAPVTAPSHG